MCPKQATGESLRLERLARELQRCAVLGELKALAQLVLPLLGEAAGANDEAALEIAASNQLIDEQARHDGLARTRIVGQ